ncbi:hypothetical protein MMC08_007040 [Hypocenomyce scalaris]|nr:hypothetical protein [Hypocenomyce scalaris]
MSSPLKKLHIFATNFNHHLSTSVSNLTLKDYIHLVIILGAYCLLRPYLLQLAGRFQAADHDRELDGNETSSAAAVSPNSLRGLVSVPQDSSDEGEEGGDGDGNDGEKVGTGWGTGADWGKKARRRQRVMIRKILEAEETLEREEGEEETESDVEIEELLVK